MLKPNPEFSALQRVIFGKSLLSLDFTDPANIFSVDYRGKLRVTLGIVSWCSFCSVKLVLTEGVKNE